MEAYVLILQKCLLKIFELFESYELTNSAQIGFVFYRDFSENDDKYNEQMKKFKPMNWQPQQKLEYIDFLNFTADLTQEFGFIYEYLLDLTRRCDGGDDYAEDIAGGFAKMLELTWLPIDQKTIRLAVLITDAPCHGKQFHEGEIDYYSDLTINKQADIRPQLDKMISKKINLIIIEINKKTQKMVKEIENYYNERERIEMMQSFKLVEDLEELKKVEIVDEEKIEELGMVLLDRLDLTLKTNFKFK